MLSKVTPNLKKLVEHFGIPSKMDRVILPFALTVIASFGKLFNKTSIKNRITLYEKSKQASATVSENFAKIIADAKAYIAVIEHTSLRRSR
ncbi:DUF5132 domain-containing protein [Nostoc sp. 106C]|uniref:DUF5132 domain-containing protein n=1 Tax=Nostoc sp. 106C TaxID=1932667 RepID=UPI000A3A7307|nr:DUF5132 domain-containing protein [Nostoc sp. 106C]OUL25014.1 DUF5132 domain-containing protein [Nostoc sp. 106C]